MKEALNKWLKKQNINLSTDTAHSLCNNLGLEGDKLDGCYGLVSEFEQNRIDAADLLSGLSLLSGKKPEEVGEILRGIKPRTEELKGDYVKPYVISPEEASTFVIGSQITSPLYHGTDPVSADKIKKEGFRVLTYEEEPGVQRMWGDGIYFSFTPAEEDAKRWGTVVLEARANVRNVYLLHLTADPSIKRYKHLSGETSDDFLEWDAYQAPDILKDYGYDALEIVADFDKLTKEQRATLVSPHQLLVFSAANVRVVV